MFLLFHSYVFFFNHSFSILHNHHHHHHTKPLLKISFQIEFFSNSSSNSSSSVSRVFHSLIHSLTHSLSSTGSKFRTQNKSGSSSIFSHYSMDLATTFGRQRNCTTRTITSRLLKVESLIKKLSEREAEEKLLFHYFVIR